MHKYRGKNNTEKSGIYDNTEKSGIYGLLLKLDPGAVIDEIYFNGDDTAAELIAFASFNPQAGLATFFQRDFDGNTQILVGDYRKIDAISFKIPPPPNI